MHRMSLIEIFKAGGPIMWPLLLCSVVAVAIIVERLINLRASRVLDPSVIERITALAESGRTDRAIAVCREQPGIFSSIALAGLEISDNGEQAAKEAVEDAGRHETARLGRYLRALATIAAVSPLLGLLGTVTGMIEVFHTIAATGGGQAAELSSGISQALITTATGLLIAIPTLVAHNYFDGRAEGLVSDLERATLRMLRGLYHGSGDDRVNLGVQQAQPAAAAGD